MRDRLRDYGADVRGSGSSYDLGDLRVIEDCGYSEGGDWLRYLVIRAYPRTASPAEIRADPRYDINSGDPPRVRHPDGVMRQVKTDGRVYLLIGDELRTMRVEMNEHTDPLGLPRAGSLDGMWAYLQQFRVAEGREAVAPNPALQPTGPAAGASVGVGLSGRPGG